MSEEIGTVASDATTQESQSDVSAGRQSPFCRELRSKRYYFLQEMPTEPHHIQDGSNRCWCRLTMQSIGPDREMVHPKGCTPDRVCYRSLFETS